MPRSLEIVLLAAVCGCASNEELVAEIQRAMTQERLAPVAACWEPAFERSGFSAERVVALDFTVAAGRLRDVAVQGVFDAGSGEAVEAPDLARCIEEGLEGVETGSLAGVRTLHVEGFRLALGDGSRAAREEARAPHVLIGPRTDRCQGLYAHEPPREVTEVEAELVRAQAATDADDPDARARALQQSYDLALELTRRLELDGARDDLPPASRERMMAQRDHARSLARTIGAQIRCP